MFQFFQTNTELRFSGAHNDAKLVYDLIVHYPKLYGLTPEQLDKEMKLQIVSEMAHEIATGKISKRYVARNVRKLKSLYNMKLIPGK